MGRVVVVVVVMLALGIVVSGCSPPPPRQRPNPSTPNGPMGAPTGSTTPQGGPAPPADTPAPMPEAPMPETPMPESPPMTAPGATPAPAKPADPPSSPDQPPMTEPTTPAAPDQTGATPLIPRREFFGNPEKARARISPDGTQLAFVAPVEGVLNVWVGPAKDFTQAKAITHDKHRGITQFFWAYTSKHILYTKDNDGDEDFHLYCIDLATGEAKDLTPIEKIHAQVEGVSEKFPEEVLVGINDRDQHQLHDIYRINLLTGEKKLIQLNPGFAGFATDDDYNVRFAMTFTPDGGQMYLKPVEKDGKPDWEEFLKIDPLDAMTTGLAGFDKTGQKVYLLDSRERNTSALKVLDLQTGASQVLAENPKADVAGAIIHPTEKTVQAVSFNYDRTQWVILDPAIQGDWDYLKTVEDGEIQITARTLDDKIWNVAYLMDNGPAKFYLYDREAKKASYLFTSTPALEKLPLVKMHPVIIKSRDGLDLVSYLSLPKESNPDGGLKPTRPLPLVLNVHGGPWARDDWGYDPEAQLWANRGYAVLSVNYRGSTGFGKDFINAANREWAGKMHDDLIDAVNWAVQEGIADPKKVAIVGGSYGGYSALVGVTFTPETFACAIDMVGPSSLITLLNNPPPYWMPFMPVMKARVGDKDTPEGIEFLKSRSPLTFVDRIQRPLLICQGAKDPRVKQAEADQIAQAMVEKKIPVTYMLFHQEGHGLAKPENRFAYYAVAEAFLAQHLGGRAEPVGDAFTGANFSLPVETSKIPGLPPAPASAPPPAPAAQPEPPPAAGAAEPKE